MESIEVVKSITFYYDVTDIDSFTSQKSAQFIASQQGIYKLFIRSNSGQTPSVRMNKKNLIDIPNKVKGHYKALTFVELFLQLKRDDILEVTLPDSSLYKSVFSIHYIMICETK